MIDEFQIGAFSTSILQLRFQIGNEVETFFSPEEKKHLKYRNDRIEYWPTQASPAYMREREYTVDDLVINLKVIGFHLANHTQRFIKGPRFTLPFIKNNETPISVI